MIAVDPPIVGRKWRIGFSQITTIWPWRAQFNKDLLAEAARHPNVELIVTDAGDDTDVQANDIDSMIRLKVDALLVAAKESVGVSESVQRAIDANIPVFVLEREIEVEGYTQFIGNDNVQIGRLAGLYAVEVLGGAGNAVGNVVEIWGGLGAPASLDRSKGFHEVTDAEPGIKHLLDRQSGNWMEDQASDVMAEALKNNRRIDLVFAHNDPMAHGAYQAAKAVDREKAIKFVGTNAVPNEGVAWVKDGKLSATILYARPGAEGLRQAVAFLGGEKVANTVVLATMTVTRNNADEIMRENGL